MMSTNDIRLRALEPEDLQLLYAIENDTQFWRFGTTTVPYSRYALRRFIEETRNDLFADGQVRMVIDINGNGRSVRSDAPHLENDNGNKWTAVGLADLFNVDALHLRAEIGLIVLPDYQGHHYGEAAIRLLCEYARGLMLHQLSATIAVTNTKASRLFERLGFTPSAHLSDWLRTNDGFVDAIVWQLIICPVQL